MPAVRPNLTVLLRQAEENNKALHLKNQELEKEKIDLSSKLKESENTLANKATLKRNSIVQELVAEEVKKASAQSEKYRVELSKVTEELRLLREKYVHIEIVKPLRKDEFNRFLASSIVELQQELSSGEEAYEFIVRDVEVEANLLVEQRSIKNDQGKYEEKMVYVLPTSQQLTNIDPQKFNRLKFSLSVVPKE